MNKHESSKSDGSGKRVPDKTTPDQKVIHLFWEVACIFKEPETGHFALVPCEPGDVALARRHGVRVKPLDALRQPEVIYTNRWN